MHASNGNCGRNGQRSAGWFSPAEFGVEAEICSLPAERALSSEAELPFEAPGVEGDAGHSLKRSTSR